MSWENCWAQSERTTCSGGAIRSGTDPPQPAIDAFRAFQIPVEMRERYGYPELTPAIKAKILGLNAARVYGIDPEKTRARTRNDEMGWVRKALDAYDASGVPGLPETD